MRRGGIPFDQLQKTNTYAKKAAKDARSSKTKFQQDDMGSAAGQGQDVNVFGQQKNGNIDDELNKSNALDTSSMRLNDQNDLFKEKQVTVENKDDPAQQRMSIGSFNNEYLD